MLIRLQVIKAQYFSFFLDSQLISSLQAMAINLQNSFIMYFKHL